MKFNDPVQGTSCPNCSVIAGLSALAWVNPAYLKSNIIDANNQVKFYNWATRGQPWAFATNMWVPAPDFCHSSQANELWPAYVEKAYVSCALNTHGDPADMATYLGALDGSASITALNRITQPQWSDFAVWAGDFYTFLNNSLSGTSNYPAGQTAPLTGSSRQVRYPFLVSTANHTYSVLGTYTTVAGVTYIILRNPKGNTVGAAPGGNLLADPTWWVNYRTYSTGNPTSDPVWTPIALTNGVFGIQRDSFTQYFQKYSRVNV